MSERIIETLHGHSTLLEQSLAQHADQLEQSGALLAQMFASGGHLVVAASGPLMGIGAAIAQAFLHNPDIERPPLPAMNLADGGGFAATMGEAGVFEQFYPAQIQAAARSGDTLLFLCAEVNAALLAGVEAARELECNSMVITVADAQPWLEAGADMVIALEAPCLARGAEVVLCYGYILAELVEEVLFGF